ncbi:MAG: ATP-binding cassette domain-containing protein, partial [Actinomycetes bacterium]
MLTISGLKVSYEGIQALRGIDLEIETGQMVALIGSNGAGKSTLLNCISGLVRPQSGIINFIKSPIIDRAAHKISRLGILHVPEGRQILGELSVLDNLLLGRIALGKRNATFSIDKVCDLFPVLR